VTKARIVLDTNVLVSAIVFGGRPRIALEKVISGAVAMAISEEMLEELRWVLEGQKFCYLPPVVQTILNELLAVSELVRPTKRVHVVHADPADNRIIECALESHADCIVTGDKHLLELGQFEGIPILSVSDFIAKP
jgi:putative PIN family toxin of toxin-antitoxin system